MEPPLTAEEAHHIVTPTEFAERLRISPSTVRSWIRRRGLEPLGQRGRYNVYDYRLLAEVERDMRAPVQ